MQPLAVLLICLSKTPNTMGTSVRLSSSKIEQIRAALSLQPRKVGPELHSGVAKCFLFPFFSFFASDPVGPAALETRRVLGAAIANCS